MAAEGVSYVNKQACLTLADTTEFILVGGFHGIDKFYTMGNGEIRRGLLAYLRSAVFASGVADRLECDEHFGLLRAASLFESGSKISI